MDTGDFHLAAVVHHGNRRFKVEWREHRDGKRVKRRRFFATQEDAIDWIDARQEERDQLGAIVATWSAAERAIVTEAARIVGGSATALLEAAQFFMRNRQRFGAVESAPTLAAVSDEMLSAKKASGKRPRYLRTLANTVALAVEEWGPVRVSQITTRAIERWLEEAGRRWPSPSSRRSRLIDLRTLFSFAVKRGYCLANPAAMIELPRHSSRPPAIFTPPAAAVVLEAARAWSPDLVGPLALGLFAGIRPEEIVRMRWRHVGARYVEVTAVNAKTHRRRLVAVTPALAAWLEVVDDKDPDLSPWPSNWRKRMVKVLRKCGVPWGHDICRHSFASYHLAAGKNAPATAHELGHGSTAMLFQHYRELVTEEAAAEFWALRPQAEPGQGPGITRPSSVVARID